MKHRNETFHLRHLRHLLSRIFQCLDFICSEFGVAHAKPISPLNRHKANANVFDVCMHLSTTCACLYTEFASRLLSTNEEKKMQN